MATTQEILNAMFNYLRMVGKVKTQVSLADSIHASRANISGALNGNPTYCTTRLCHRINDAYGGIFSKTWIETGEGKMLATGENASITYTNSPQHHNNINSPNARIYENACDNVEELKQRVVELESENKELRGKIFELELDRARLSGMISVLQK